VALVRERTIPTERPPPVGEVSANFVIYATQNLFLLTLVHPVASKVHKDQRMLEQSTHLHYFQLGWL